MNNVNNLFVFSIEDLGPRIFLDQELEMHGVLPRVCKLFNEMEHSKALNPYWVKLLSERGIVSSSDKARFRIVAHLRDYCNFFMKYTSNTIPIIDEEDRNNVFGMKYTSNTIPIIDEEDRNNVFGMKYTSNTIPIIDEEDRNNVFGLYAKIHKRKAESIQKIFSSCARLFENLARFQENMKAQNLDLFISPGKLKDMDFEFRACLEANPNLDLSHFNLNDGLSLKISVISLRLYMQKNKNPVDFYTLQCALENKYPNNAIRLMLKNFDKQTIRFVYSEDLQLAIKSYAHSPGLGNNSWKNLISQGPFYDPGLHISNEAREIMKLIPKPCLNLSYIPDDILKEMILKCRDIKKYNLSSAIGHVSEDILNLLLEHGVKINTSDMICVLEYGYSEEFVLRLNNLFTEMYDEKVHTIEMALLRNYSQKVIQAIESKYPPKSNCITM
jgi:plasmid maintenance system antidote protein VapI